MFEKGINFISIIAWVLYSFLIKVIAVKKLLTFDWNFAIFGNIAVRCEVQLHVKHFLEWIGSSLFLLGELNLLMFGNSITSENLG